jgi:hypothetical protein
MVGRQSSRTSPQLGHADDPHSPCGTVFSLPCRLVHVPTLRHPIRSYQDFARFPELVWLNRFDK